MPTLSSIDFWPATGFPDRPWCAEPEVDAWVKSSRRVCEVYSVAVAKQRLTASAANLRFMAGPVDDSDDAADGNDIVVYGFAEAGFEGARVEVPVAVKDLPPLVRARAVLDAIDCAMRQIAPFRGWSTRVLKSLRDEVLDSGFHFAWQGRAVTSPDRRRTAQTRFTLADDGYGRVLVEITNREDGNVTSTSAPLLAYSTIKGFKRSSKSLRWVGSNQLTIAHYVDAFGLDKRTATISLDADLETNHPCTAQVRESRAQRAIAVPNVVEPPPPGPRIRGGGGGPMNDVPPLYQAATMWTFDHIPPPLTEWWAGTGLIELDVTHEFWGDKVGARLYRHGNNLRATFRRPMPDPAAVSDPIGVAQQDIRAVLDAVQRRFRLPPPPELPLPAEADLNDLVATLAEVDDDPLSGPDIEEMWDVLPPSVQAALAEQDANEDD